MNSGMFTRRTRLIDFDHPAINALVKKRGWEQLDEYEKIGAVYNFVRDEIAFGYNAADDLPASRILSNGIGQCNTKSTLFMALLRRLGIPCRLHSFLIDKKVQKGLVPGLMYLLAPETLVHSWVEVLYQDQWIEMEGYILDKPYLTAIQQRFPQVTGEFVGYAVGAKSLVEPPIDWNGQPTYIQNECIRGDLGVHADPDSFYWEQDSDLSGLKKLIYRFYARHRMNLRVWLIRRKVEVVA
jgi:transglutaminase-like putative cysteine protease